MKSFSTSVSKRFVEAASRSDLSIEVSFDTPLVFIESALPELSEFLPSLTRGFKTFEIRQPLAYNGCFIAFEDSADACSVAAIAKTELFNLKNVIGWEGPMYDVHVSYPMSEIEKSNARKFKENIGHNARISKFVVDTIGASMRSRFGTMLKTLAMLVNNRALMRDGHISFESTVKDTESDTFRIALGQDFVTILDEFHELPYIVVQPVKERKNGKD